MDRFQLMTVFVAVAEEESFAAGARRLSMSPPAVTRAIAMLETRLGIKLLTRTTRHVRATDAGLRYLDSARRILADAEEADEAAAGIHAAPRGQLAVTAPVLFGSMFVTPAIVGYLERYPDVTLNAVFLDRVVNLLEEGLDVGVRIGELPDSSMRAIPVGHVRRVVCAAPDYLAQYGEPDEPQALAGHRLINASTVSPASEWRFGNAIAVKIQPRLTVTNNEAAIQAALRGFGITRLISYQVAAHLAAGRLKRILPTHEPAPLPIHVLHREGRQASAKVRSFVDFLVGDLRERLGGIEV
jgi:DNA-binding transcriptional LysR family regulator